MKDNSLFTRFLAEYSLLLNTIKKINVVNSHNGITYYRKQKDIAKILRATQMEIEELNSNYYDLWLFQHRKESEDIRLSTMVQAQKIGFYIYWN